MTAVRVGPVPLLIGFSLIVPSATWLTSTGGLAGYWDHTVPVGQLLYLGSKLTALYALVALWVQFTYGALGLSARTRLGLERGPLFHRQLGLVTWSLVAAHATLFVGGASLRVGHVAWQFIVPAFDAGYYLFMTSLGIVAFVALSVAVGVALARQRVGRWRMGHYLVYVVVGLVAWHSVAIGTESRMAPMVYLYGAMGSLTLLALCFRISIGPTPALR